MLSTLITLINRLEILSALKIQAMENIVRRNGVGEELEKLIIIDINLYNTIQKAKVIANILAREPPN